MVLTTECMREHGGWWARAGLDGGYKLRYNECIVLVFMIEY